MVFRFTIGLSESSVDFLNADAYFSVSIPDWRIEFRHSLLVSSISYYNYIHILLYLFLCLYDITYGIVIDRRVDVAFHHRASIIVLDVALPTLLRHPTLLTEALLLEVPDRVVVSIRQQVLYILFLHLLLVLVH
jgi:hypothetical protein